MARLTWQAGSANHVWHDPVRLLVVVLIIGLNERKMAGNRTPKVSGLEVKYSQENAVKTGVMYC